MDLPFTTLDVFTTTRLLGNPLAVVTVPSALRRRLTHAAKQKIAQEFNLSETVFLHEGSGDCEDENEGDESREIDIFTVEREIPFAGHPTIGTAVYVRYHQHQQPQASASAKDKAAVKTLITKAGPITLEPLTHPISTSTQARGIRARIPHAVHLHAKTLRDVLPSSPEDHPGLSPHAAIRAAELRAPVFSIVNGMTFVLVQLPNLCVLAEVRTSRLDFETLPVPLLDEGWRDSLVCRYYYVDVDGDGDGDGEAGGREEMGESEEGVRYLRTRMEELGFEDPATGSAATALGAYLTLTEEKRGRRFQMTQGVEIGRRSVISVETTTTTVENADGEGVKLGDVWLGGTAVVVMQGSLRVDV
ncbi:Uu.00g054350.m01.CDS01 [Anthostomella pinea]|uniref:Uu.00g054350.m01.CDS01 n=1 Tax=Anthostomella pinea TaxID=933095 RepID=A0AAI8VXI1_9PEZI|nr:Uu.00g054350.m01.CDS01 [Anthostomella pinea]